VINSSLNTALDDARTNADALNTTKTADEFSQKVEPVQEAAEKLQQVLAEVPSIPGELC
jgi:hypothetical protein